jgi:hypothetical protein
MLRTEAGHSPHDKGLSNLIGELSTRSENFRTWWAAHNVRFHRTGTKRFHRRARHPLRRRAQAPRHLGRHYRPGGHRGRRGRGGHRGRGRQLSSVG